MTPRLPATSLSALAVAIVVGAAGATAAVDRLGASRRTIASAARVGEPALQVLIVTSGKDAVASWRARGLRARRVLHFGRFLHFVPQDPAVAAQILIGPGTGERLDRVHAAGAGNRDYLWVAASLGIARRVDYVSPEPSLDARLAALGLDRGALPLAADADDVPRALHAAVPPIDEPVLVSIHASWFDEATAEQILGGMQAAGIRTDVVVVDLAREADDVSPSARQSAISFASALRGGSGTP